MRSVQKFCHKHKVYTSGIHNCLSVPISWVSRSLYIFIRKLVLKTGWVSFKSFTFLHEIYHVCENYILTYLSGIVFFFLEFHYSKTCCTVLPGILRGILFLEQSCQHCTVLQLEHYFFVQWCTFSALYRHAAYLH